MENYSTFLPDDIKLRKYTDGKITFAYPDNANFSNFYRDDGSESIHLIYQYNNQSVRIDIDRLNSDYLASQLVSSLFSTVGDNSDNIPPVLVRSRGLEFWRMRHLFIEGGKDMKLCNTAYCDVLNKVYRMQYYAHPSEFFNGSWVFEVVLLTFQIENIPLNS